MKPYLTLLFFSLTLIVIYPSFSLTEEKIQQKLISLPQGTEHIEIHGLFEVILSTAQEDSSLTISSEVSNLSNIIINIDEQTLLVDTKDRILSQIMRPKLIIKISQLISFSSSGVIDSTLYVNNNQHSLTIRAEGVSKIKLYGHVNNMNIKAYGTSKIQAETLNIKEAVVELKGSSFAYFKRRTKIYQEVSGVSKVYLLD